MAADMLECLWKL